MSNNSLTVTVRPPLYSVADQAGLESSIGNIYNNLFDYATGNYSQKKSATVGYDTMSMTIAVPDDQMRDWVAKGLGRHIEVYSSSGIVWEGFVNEISANVGPVNIKAGPLTDISNRIKVTYTTRQYNTNPPIGGEQAETAFAVMSASVGRWGFWEKVISGGGDVGVSATMTALRDSKLNELSWPKVSSDLSFNSTGSNSITISCLGYYYYLAAYLFDSNTGDTGEVNVSTKMDDVFTDDPNGFFPTKSIETNTLQVPSYDDGNKSAMEAIQELVGLGFASGERALFMVGPKRHVTYKSTAVDKEPKYVYSLYDKSFSITNRDEGVPELWDIEPGEWIRLQSLNAKPFYSSLPRHSDPGYIFIEEVEYTSPNSISITGGLNGTLKDKLSRSGLGFTKG